MVSLYAFVQKKHRFSEIHSFGQWIVQKPRTDNFHSGKFRTSHFKIKESFKKVTILYTLTLWWAF